MIEITFVGQPLESLAWALAEGEHGFGEDATAAGWSLVCQWTGNDCPWFEPGPSRYGSIVDADVAFVEWE
jgi:hypothetical protein